MLLYLRNRKHVPCFYRVIQTRVEVWEDENVVGTQAAGECFHSFFEFSQTFTSVSKLDRNTENMFSISFRKQRDQQKENNLLILIMKM